MNKQTYTIGRAAGNDIRIKDISISRRHAILKLRAPGHVELYDCNSSNGTFVNGKRITVARVREGDRIRFGSCACHLGQLIPKNETPFKTARPQIPAILKVIGALCILLFVGILGKLLIETGSISQPQVPPAPTQAPSAREAVPPPPTRRVEQSTRQRIEQATVLVLTPRSCGSGFFITPNILITNRHVVQNAREVLIYNTFLGRRKAWVTAVGREPWRDYAVLVSETNNPSCLPLCPDIERGSKISSWGYPGFMTEHSIKAGARPEVMLTSGEVSALQTIDKHICILHTAQIAQGNSGGPLVNENGSVVGINTAGVVDKVMNGQFAIALPSRDVIAFLRANRIPFAEEE